MNKIRQYFSLNLYEVKLWTAILSRGMSTAGELSDIADVPRSRTYDVLESLERKGFVIVKPEKPIKYIAIPPREVITRVHKKIEKDLEKFSKRLEKISNSDIMDELNELYNCLDLYIVSSREEGGPKAIVESMASGVPIVSTNVGMAKDFIIDKYNGGLVDNFEPESIAQKSIEILNILDKKAILNAARNDVMRADWNIVSHIYWEKVYKPAIRQLNDNINF